MRKRNIWLVAAAILVVGAVYFGGGFWTASQQGANDGARQREAPTVAERPGSILREGRTRTTVPEAVQDRDGFIFRFVEQLPNGWEARYPNAAIEAERIYKLDDDRYRRQQQIATQVERLPWVIWEDKVGVDENGELQVFGYAAYVGNVVLVDADPTRVPPAELEDFIAENGLYVERRSQVSEYVCLGFENPSLGRVESLIARFQERFRGVIAEFDAISFPSAFPSDWDSAKMWGLDNVYAPDAWDFATGAGDQEIVVAVIDTGVDISHPDLAGNIFVNPAEAIVDGRDGAQDSNTLVDDRNGWDFLDGDSDPSDSDGHGTHVAGIVGAIGNNNRGAVGVNWNVKILPLRVGNDSGLRTSAINDALDYVADLASQGTPINIVATNNSYGSGGYSASTRNEIQRHQDLGILFVAASGNDGKDLDAIADAQEYPAGYDLATIISVGNSNQENGLNGSSNYGRASVDISAPGSEIYSTYPGDDYAFLSGTSMASPMVAGAVALLARAEPTLTGTQIKQRLMTTADRIVSQNGLTVSEGRLNLLSALRPAMSGHDLAVTNVLDGLVLVDSVEARPAFELDYHPSATIGAAVVEGSGVGEIVSTGGGRFRFDPANEGVARIRFTSTLQGIEREVEKTVVFGDFADVGEGLIHHFDFSGSGLTVNDKAGNANGTLSGAGKTGSEYGSALNFGSSSSKMSFAGTFSERVTIAALVRSNNLSASPHPRIVNMPFYYLYFSSGVGANVPDGNRQTLKFYSNFESSGTPTFGVWNAPPNSVRDGQWYFVAGTYDSSQVLNTPELYINGAPQVVRMQQEPRGSIANPGGLSFLGNDGGNTRAFAGLMADVRVYDRELSQTEIAQLAVSLVKDRWQSVKIVGPESVQLGSVTEYSVQSGSDLSGEYAVEWTLVEAGTSEIVAAAGDTASIRFTSMDAHVVQAQVSDGMVTHVFTKTVATADGSTQEGSYIGSTSGGGVALLEVSEGLTEGRISLFDPATGFYRIREPVTIDESGYFETEEDSLGRIVGSALFTITGEVAGYDVSFSGELQTPPSSQSELAGMYRGGAVGVIGDAMELEVDESGGVVFWRSGPRADFVVGSVNAGGALVGTSASGNEVVLAIDENEFKAAGLWGEDPFFLKEAGLAPEASFEAVAFGGSLAGSGSGGFYGRLIFDGEEPASDDLLDRVFDRAGDLSERAGPFVVVDPRGRRVFSAAAVSDSTLSGLAESLERIEPTTDSPIVGMRLQTPIVEGGLGVVVFEVRGGEPLEVLARGLGRSFSQGGGEDPQLSLFRFEDGEAVFVDANGDWREGALFTSANEKAQGAFRNLELGFEGLKLSGLEAEAKDAAFRVWLEPGRYLLAMELATGEPGSGLLELFELE